MARNLQDALREPGYVKDLEAAAGALTDVRQRPDCIADLAAERVLVAAEHVKSLQKASCAAALDLQKQWVTALSGRMDAIVLFDLGLKSQDYLGSVQAHHDQVDDELNGMMLAQDRRDLTSQAIQRTNRLARSIEKQTVKWPLDASFPTQRKEVLENMSARPMINSEARDDVVASPGQVDDLLHSLGLQP